MIQEFLITVQTDERTRFTQEPEHFRTELESYAQKLFTVHTQGTVPAVTVATMDETFFLKRAEEIMEIFEDEDRTAQEKMDQEKEAM